MCGFKDIYGVNRMKWDAVKGHAVWRYVNWVLWVLGYVSGVEVYVVKVGMSGKVGMKGDGGYEVSVGCCGKVGCVG